VPTALEPVAAGVVSCSISSSVLELFVEEHLSLCLALVKLLLCHLNVLSFIELAYTRNSVLEVLEDLAVRAISEKV